MFLKSVNTECGQSSVWMRHCSKTWQANTQTYKFNNRCQYQAEKFDGWAIILSAHPCLIRPVTFLGSRDFVVAIGIVLRMFRPHTWHIKRRWYVIFKGTNPQSKTDCAQILVHPPYLLCGLGQIKPFLPPSSFIRWGWWCWSGNDRSPHHIGCYTQSTWTHSWNRRNVGKYYDVMRQRDSPSTFGRTSFPSLSCIW